MKNIRVVELFAGVGGFRIGLEKASDIYKFVWANQWEPGSKLQHAYDCYVKHYGESENHVNEDIAKVIDKVPEHDLLVGGFPCQDYSVARTNAQGIHGKKGVLWWEIDKILAKRNPKMVLLENVDRLLKSPTIQRGRDFAIILKCFQEKGYSVDWMVINAADYGLPQKRRRVFIFAYKNTKNVNDLKENDLLERHFFRDEFKFSLKTQVKQNDMNKYKDVLAVSDSFNDGKFMNVGKMVNGQIIMADYNPIYDGNKIVLNDLVENCPDAKFYLNEIQVERAKVTKQSKKKERTTVDGFTYTYAEGSMSFPDALNLPARTMLTSEATLNRSTHYLGDEKGFRTLTPLEAERINCFPDNWTDTGMPEKFRYFCMGNALVVGVIEKLGNCIKEFYE